MYPCFDFLWSLKNVKAVLRPQAMQTQTVAGFLFLRCSLQPPPSSLVPRTLTSPSLKKFHEHRNVNIFLKLVLQHNSEKAMAPHSSTLAWKIPWMEKPGRLQSMGSLRVGHDFTFIFTFHFHALEKEMATHSSVLAWRIPGTGEPGRLPSMGSHRVGHDWRDLKAGAAAAAHTLSGSLV